jgi:hypothetical protein
MKKLDNSNEKKGRILENPRKHRDITQRYIENGAERRVNQNTKKYFINDLYLKIQHSNILKPWLLSGRAAGS